MNSLVVNNLPYNINIIIRGIRQNISKIDNIITDTNLVLYDSSNDSCTLLDNTLLLRNVNNTNQFMLNIQESTLLIYLNNKSYNIQLTDDPNIDLKLTEVIKTLKCQS